MGLGIRKILTNFNRKHTGGGFPIVESVVFFAGAVICGISLYQQRVDLAIAVACATLVADLFLFSIKAHIRSVAISEMEKLKSDCLAILDLGHRLDKESDLAFKKVNRQWMPQLRKMISKYHTHFENLCNNKLVLVDRPIVSLGRYQAELYERAETEILAIHTATSEESLKLWEPENSGISLRRSLYQANKQVRKGVAKKRLFILSDQFDTDNELLMDVLEDQRKTLGFNVKVMYESDYARDHPQRKDLMIVDECEMVQVHFSGHKITNAAAYFDKDIVKEERADFMFLWNYSAKDDPRDAST